MDLEARIARLERIIGGNGHTTSDGRGLTGEAALAWMDGEEMSIFGGLANTQAAVSKLASATAGSAQAAGAPAEGVSAIEQVVATYGLPHVI